MENLFLVLFLVSLVGVGLSIYRTIVSFVKKDYKKRKSAKRLALSSVAAGVLSIAGVAMTSPTPAEDVATVSSSIVETSTTVTKEKDSSEAEAKKQEQLKTQESERLEKEKIEAEKRATEQSEQSEQERMTKEKEESEKLAAEKAEQERVEKEKAEAERLVNEQVAQQAAANPYVDANGLGLIKGSKNKIYHVPGSTYYDRTTNPEALFTSIEETEAAGYRAPLR